MAFDKARMADMKEQAKVFSQFYKDYLKKKPLFEKMDDEYRNNSEEVKAFNERMKELKIIYKPLEEKEFQEHYLKYK